jgi:hypothetical protein
VPTGCGRHAAPGDRKGVFQMRKTITHVAMAVAAAAALSMLGGIGAGAAGPDATAATLAARAGPAGALQPAAAPGTQLWVHRFRGGGENRVAASPDGSKVFVLAGIGNDYATFAYDAAIGAREWAAHYAGALTVFSMAASPDGTQVFITGWTAESGTVNWDYVTIAYATATGAQRWARTYDGPAGRDDVAYSVAVSPSGSTVYVTGLSEGGSTGLDYATIAYGTVAGAQQWLQRYNGLGNGDDWAYSVAVGPDGKVFVTGNSQYGLSATIAYSG